MAETIESFVTKLQEEGVQAGQQAAKKLRDQAQQQADQLIAEARAKAEKIVAEANAQAENTRERGRIDLNLAARDVVLKLRESLNKVLRMVLAARTKEKLADVDFLGKILHEIILLYAKADTTHKGRIQINVPEKTRQSLIEWTMREISQEKLEGLDMSIDLKGTLTQAGFEYNVTGATVEITEASVVDALAELVSPALREIVQGTLDTDKKANGRKKAPEKGK